MKKSKSMSIYIGFAVGIFCVVFAIFQAGKLGSFIDSSSALVTFGGTIGAVIIAFPVAKLKLLWPGIRKAFSNQSYDLQQDIELIVSLAESVRRKGLLMLEEAMEKQPLDRFMKKGLALILDGAEKEQVRDTLEAEIYFTQQRHGNVHQVLDMIADTAPSMGLLGTYIGLVMMLENLNDPSKIGPMMALQLLTSLYGAFVSYIIFGPLSRKLKGMDEDEALHKEFLIEGLIALSESQNPRLIRENLTFYAINNTKISQRSKLKLQNSDEKVSDIREVA